VGSISGRTGFPLLPQRPTRPWGPSRLLPNGSSFFTSGLKQTKPKLTTWLWWYRDRNAWSPTPTLPYARKA
jgi:hypothetical protein